MFVSRHRALIALIIALGWAGSLGLAARALASDHQDTPEVELNSRCDINDVYAFPGSTDDRICLVMTTSSPIAGGTAASFDPDKLYQIKIDNGVTDAFVRDGVEDLVLQFTFRGTGASQQVSVRGPVAPLQTGPLNKVSTSAPTVSGAINANLGSAAAMQVFCGLKDDPFFLDLSQFFRIVPDRRPSTGPLAGPAVADTACFRPVGAAQDYLAGYNCLAIVVELPKAQLTNNGANPRLGIWGTISR